VNEPAPEGFRQWRYTPPPGSTTLLLIRHGESAPADPLRPFPLRDGHGDPPLHPDGVRQAERLAERLVAEHHDGAPIDAIYVTTLRRTHQTAEPLAVRLGLEPRVEPDLREVYLGDWEGGEFRIRAAQGDPIFARIFAEERWDVIPGAEPLEDFDARLRRGLGRIIDAHPDQRVAVVVHGGVIGQLLHQATGSSRFAFAAADNASVSELVVHGERQILRRFNDTAHLLEPLGTPRAAL
jgi:probable phosphoglycerate mutase